MKKLQLLILFICLIGISNLFAQSSILLKDTAGVEHPIIFEKTKVTLVFRDPSRKPIHTKIGYFENGNFFSKKGEMYNVDMIEEIQIMGPKSVTAKPLAIYYFCSVNASVGLMFLVAGNGLGTILVDALIILVTPITLGLMPYNVARNARKQNPTILPMKGNLR